MNKVIPVENPVKNNEFCPICLEKFGESLAMLFAHKCKCHPICVKCFKETVDVNIHKNCPICREALQSRMIYAEELVINKIKDTYIWSLRDLNLLPKELLDINELKDVEQELIVCDFVEQKRKSKLA